MAGVGLSRAWTKRAMSAGLVEPLLSMSPVPQVELPLKASETGNPSRCVTGLTESVMGRTEATGAAPAGFEIEANIGIVKVGSVEWNGQPNAHPVGLLQDSDEQKTGALKPSPQREPSEGRDASEVMN